MIAAIDPGPEQSALVVYSPGEWPVVDALLEPNDVILERLPGMPGSLLVVEKIVPYGRQVGAVTFDTAYWSGRFAQRWVDRGLCTSGRNSRVHFLSNPEIRRAICGSPKAAERDVIYALTQRLGGKGTKKAPGPLYGMRSHLWSALAVAVAWGDLHPTP